MLKHVLGPDGVRFHDLAETSRRKRLRYPSPVLRSYSNLFLAQRPPRTRFRASSLDFQFPQSIEEGSNRSKIGGSRRHHYLRPVL